MGSTAPTNLTLQQRVPGMQSTEDCLVPFRCRRFKDAKGRDDSIATALEHEFDQCFSKEFKRHSRVFSACKPLAISIAMCTSMPLMHPAVCDALNDTHVIVDAVAYRFCVYLGDTWFAIDNHGLTDVAAKLLALRPFKLDHWHKNSGRCADHSPKDVMVTAQQFTRAV